jgi:hypothetical protein
MHRNYLKRLRLDTRKHYDSWPERDDGLVPPLGDDLKAFTKLTRLDVPASAILGWDEDHNGGFSGFEEVLPQNLEELKSNEHAPRLVEELERWIPVIPERYPKLRKLSISIDTDGETNAEGRLTQMLKELCPEVRFSFEEPTEVDHWDGSIASASVDYGRSN